jgi:hypothetical protein
VLVGRENAPADRGEGKGTESRTGVRCIKAEPAKIRMFGFVHTSMTAGDWTNG